MSDLIGETLNDRYDLLADLGIGKMGHVYRAQDRERGCLVAIKMMNPPPLGGADELERRFRREAEVLIQLKHPHIVSLYEFEEQAKPPFLVLEYIEGQSLAQRMEARRHKPLSLTEALNIIRPIAGALHFAHQHDVYHRDIKPENILLDAHGKPYLADFGTALLKREDWTRLTTHTRLIGTPRYAAPEQWRSQEVDARTDVYALGVLLYELLTGQLPFTADSPALLMRQVLKDDPRPPRQLNRRIPPAIEQVILKAMSKDKKERYPDAKDMLDALSKAREPKREHRRLQDWQKPILAAVSTLVVLVSIFGGMIRFGLVSFGKVRETESTLISPVSSRSPTTAVTTTIVPSSTSTLVPSPSLTDTPTATPTPVPTMISPPTHTPTSPPPPTLVPTPQLVVDTERLDIYEGPGRDYDIRGEVRRGDRLSLTGRSEDGMWWQVNYFGQPGWILAQPATPIEPTVLPIVTAPPTPTKIPTPTATETPTLPPRIALRNPGFEQIREDTVPGWQWEPYDNYDPDGDYDPDKSFDTPLLKQADDPARMIDGPTLQIDAAGHLKFMVYIFQTVDVPPTVTLHLQALAGAYSDMGGIKVAVGVDPDGSSDCSRARWGDKLVIDQSSGRVPLAVRDVPTGNSRRATVCLYAETLYAARSNAAFFDSAELLVNPE